MNKKPDLQNARYTFAQVADTSSLNEHQFIEIEQVWVPGSGHGQEFFWRINTDEWAFDSIEEVVDLLKRAKVKESGTTE